MSQISEPTWPKGNGSGNGDTLNLAGCDNDAAAAKLADFLTRHSIKAVHQSAGAVMVDHHMRKFALAPKVQDGGLSRIVVHEYWAAKRDNVETEFVRFVNRLNGEYNTGAFYVDSDGDLAYQTQMTFIDRIAWEHVEAFLTWHDHSLFAVLFTHKEELTGYVQ